MSKKRRWFDEDPSYDGVPLSQSLPEEDYPPVKHVLQIERRVFPQDDALKVIEWTCKRGDCKNTVHLSLRDAERLDEDSALCDSCFEELAKEGDEVFRRHGIILSVRGPLPEDEASDAD